MPLFPTRVTDASGTVDADWGGRNRGVRIFRLPAGHRSDSRNS